MMLKMFYSTSSPSWLVVLIIFPPELLVFHPHVAFLLPETNFLSPGRSVVFLLILKAWGRWEIGNFILLCIRKLQEINDEEERFYIFSSLRSSCYAKHGEFTRMRKLEPFLVAFSFSSPLGYCKQVMAGNLSDLVADLRWAQIRAGQWSWEKLQLKKASTFHWKLKVSIESSKFSLKAQ